MSKQPWDWHRVKSELHRRGMTLTGLAKINDMTPSILTSLGNRPNAKAEKIIAKFLDEKLTTVFPDRYPKKRTRILHSKYLKQGESQKCTTPPDTVAA